MSEPITTDLAGKSVLITGASTGIGAAAARAFARADAAPMPVEAPVINTDLPARSGTSASGTITP